MSGWLMKVASPGSGADTLDAAKRYPSLVGHFDELL